MFLHTKRDCRELKEGENGPVLPSVLCAGPISTSMNAIEKEYKKAGCIKAL
jgi:hypothetical protein